MTIFYFFTLFLMLMCYQLELCCGHYRRFAIKSKSTESPSKSVDQSTVGIHSNAGLAGETSVTNAAKQNQTTVSTPGPISRKEKALMQFRAQTTKKAQKNVKRPPPKVRLRTKSEEEDLPAALLGFNRISPQYIKKAMQEIACTYSGINISISTIGRTIEHNDIVLMRISDQYSKLPLFRADQNKYIEEPPQKKIIFIVHALTPRGLSSLPCLSQAKEFKALLSIYLEHLEWFDILLMPMANPDGASKSYTSGIWDKNVSPQKECPGVNLDRNFDVSWEGDIKGSCSQDYHGSMPFSEPETRAIRDVLHLHHNQIAAYINVHAGTYDSDTFKGDAVLFPHGGADVTGDDDKYLDLKDEILDVMRNATFEAVSVTVEPLYNWYGKVTGTSVDYCSMIYGIPYSLEFVMQIYSGEANSGAKYSDLALSQIWKRIINAVFHNIYVKTYTAHDENIFK